jgi:hypothetical protein
MIVRYHHGLAFLVLTIGLLDRVLEQLVVPSTALGSHSIEGEVHIWVIHSLLVSERRHLMVPGAESTMYVHVNSV